MSQVTGRKTEKITFNLRDRGRKYTGQDRSNVDIQAWINTINSPESQEMISTRSLFGYYGHFIRHKWGINPPETVLVEGKLLTLTPAVRTIYMKADQDGNVTHQQEFMKNPEGEKAMDIYRSNAGGFSAVTDFIVGSNGMVKPTVNGGMDFVLQANYATNSSSTGLLVDSVAKPIDPEFEFLHMYDSIHGTNHLYEVLDKYRCLSQQQAEKLIEHDIQKAERARLYAERHQLQTDSALCQTIPMDEYLRQNRMFDNAQVFQEQEKEPEVTIPVVRKGFFGWF